MKFSKEEALARRHRRVRAKVSGTAERPRLAVHRSNSHMYAQVIDDTRGHTLVAATTNEPAFREKASAELKSATVSGAKAVGALIAERAKAAGITSVVFDRGGYPYHGRVKALAEGAREGGLEF